MDNRKQMFDAVCDQCGNKCQVPFQPSGGKPVLCSVCFGNKGNINRSRSGGSRFGGDRRDRRMFEATCDKCGNKCEVPFQPSGDKPIYCNSCFGKKSDRGDRRGGGGRDSRGGGGNDQLSQQLKSLSNKLDRIISLLDPGASKKEFPKKEDVSKSSPKKPSTKKKTVKKVSKKKGK